MAAADNSNPPALLSRVGHWFRSTSISEPSADQQEGSARRTRANSDTVSVRERATRKARMDLVKKKELGELRHLLDEVITEDRHPFSSNLKSSPLLGQVAKVRTETRDKINSIEAQMSRSWYLSSAHSTSAKIPGDIRHSAEAASIALSKSTVQRVMRVKVHETLVDFIYPPDAVNASIAFAIGDYISAERILVLLCNQQDTLDRLITSWELRFELYMSVTKKTEFEDASVDFAAKFGKSPPMWQPSWGIALVQTIETIAELAPPLGIVPRESALDFQVPAVVDMASATQLALLFSHAKLTPSFRVSWNKVKTIHHEALEKLNEVLIQFSDWSGQLSYAAGPRLTKVLNRDALAAKEPIERRKRWLLLLNHLRLMGNVTAYENAGVDYCLNVEESAPPFIPAVCHLVEIGSSERSDAQSLSSITDAFDFEVTQILSGTSIRPTLGGQIEIDDQARTVILKGVLTGDISQTVAQLPRPTPEQSLIFECGSLVRIDAQAASNLLNFLREAESTNGQVVFNQIHRLIGIYFYSFGLPANVILSIIDLH
jgi:hypothetical protein